MSEYIFYDVEQNTDEWLELRRGKITASSFNVLMAHYGKAFGDPAKSLALTKALEKATGNVIQNGYTNQYMENGHIREHLARLAYEEENFITVTNGGFFDCGRYGTSPDGLVGLDGIIEIKSVIPTTHYDNLVRGSYGPSYKWQLVGHLYCTGRDWVDFISYCPEFTRNKQILIYRLTKEECIEQFNQLEQRINEFNLLVSTILEQIL